VNKVVYINKISYQHLLGLRFGPSFYDDDDDDDDDDDRTEQ